MVYILHIVSKMITILGRGCVHSPLCTHSVQSCLFSA